MANHSVRKTSISRLLDAGVPENFVTQLSGHKNNQSLTAYKSASSSQQRSMSDTLSRASVNESRSTMAFSQQSLQCSATSVAARSPFAKLTPRQSFQLFAGATIDSISNCVFNINPGLNVDHGDDSVSAKRQKTGD